MFHWKKDLAMTVSRKLVSIFSALILSGCAHTVKEKVFQNMLIAGAAGVAVGQSREEYKGTYSVMYGGIAAATASALTLYFNDPDKENQRLRDEAALLRKQMDSFTEPKLTGVTPATFGAKVPDKYKGMINPGEWRIYEIDRWVEDAENRMIHQDKVMELIPPTLSPSR
ncbi:hypothetical protein [Bdellovibrio sp. HCB-162]|uniref:hypothetical protein n=1 Tax=Bdellovibrio sp. HCB-162 TaxID=3394234 RepID=UPI0039BD75DA